MLPTTVIFLEADGRSLLRRFSETRRPHPLGTDSPVKSSLAAERRHLQPIRAMADLVVDTSKFNVHELRAHITEPSQAGVASKNILVSWSASDTSTACPRTPTWCSTSAFCPIRTSFRSSARLPGATRRSRNTSARFPQTQEFIDRISELLVYLLPHYVREGKSYLTIGFGCTGGQHRSVLIAEEVRKRLAQSGIPGEGRPSGLARSSSRRSSAQCRRWLT